VSANHLAQFVVTSQETGREELSWHYSGGASDATAPPDYAE